MTVLARFKKVTALLYDLNERKSFGIGVMMVRRIPIGWSVIAVLLGCGLILFAGGNADKGIPGWKPLNAEIEEAISMVETDSAKSVPLKSESMKEPIQQEKDDSVPKGQVEVKESSAPDSAASEDTSLQVAEQPKPAAGEIQTSEKADDQPSADESAGKININTAVAAELMDLPGIGEKKAQAIIDYRAKHGPFRSVSELMDVKGIGPKMLEKMKPYVTL
nr:ComEA family DNA-binding protein [Paenibacillus faecalis]